MSFLGLKDLTVMSLKSAGEIDSDALYNEKKDEFSRCPKITCPNCQEVISPFQSKTLKHCGTTNSWVSLESQDIIEHYKSTCAKCKKDYSLKVRYKQ